MTARPTPDSEPLASRGPTRSMPLLIGVVALMAVISHTAVRWLEFRWPWLGGSLWTNLLVEVALLVTLLLPVAILFQPLLNSLARCSRTMRELQDYGARFETLFGHSSIGMAIIGRSGHFMRTNPMFQAILGLPEAELAGLHYSKLLFPEDLDRVTAAAEAFLSGKDPQVKVEHRFRRRDGHTIWIRAQAWMYLGAGGAPEFAFVLLEDITGPKEAEQSLQLTARIFEQALEGIVITDAGGAIERVNPAFTAITGFTLAEVAGKNPSVLKSQHHPPQFYAEMWNRLKTQGQWSGEIWNRRKSGEVYPEWLSIASILGSDGRVERYMSVFTDISEQKAREASMRYKAFHDALTGLPNRFLFTDRLSQALVHCRRCGGMLGVFFLDLDNFKQINDSLGHLAGDEVLKSVAGRLSGCMRAEDSVARIGGDEFVALLRDVSEVEVEQVARRILREVAEPIHLAGGPCQLTLSLGISLSPRHGTDPEVLLRAADHALYQAKTLGRNRYYISPEPAGESDSTARPHPDGPGG